MGGSEGKFYWIKSISQMSINTTKGKDRIGNDKKQKLCLYYTLWDWRNSLPPHHSSTSTRWKNQGGCGCFLRCNIVGGAGCWSSIKAGPWPPGHGSETHFLLHVLPEGVLYAKYKEVSNMSLGSNRVHMWMKFLLKTSLRLKKEIKRLNVKNSRLSLGFLWGGG